MVRQALKEVELDSSRRVELDDYVDVCLILLGKSNECLKGRVADCHLL